MRDGIRHGCCRSVAATDSCCCAVMPDIPSVRLVHPVEVNEIFPTLPAALRDELRVDGFEFYDCPDANAAA